MPNSEPSFATIPAAHNLTIEIGPHTWRLINGARPPGGSAALVEATAEGLRYSPAFARARQLPLHGQLAAPDIARIVVGWAPETQSWHLGLLLAALDSGQARWRWCGLASWRGAQAEREADARRAAQALARLLDRPLHVVPPPHRSQESGAPVVLPVRAPARAEPALRTLPVQFEEWSFVTRKNGLAWRQRSGWIVGMFVRAIGLTLIALVFLLLGLGTLTSGLAQVNPTWLPWLGLLVALALLGAASRVLWRVVTATDVLLDTVRREVWARGRFSGKVRWRVPFDRVAYVLLSQTPPRPQGRKGKDGPMRVMQEMWIHLADGERFWPVAALGQVEGTSAQWEEARARLKQPGRRRVRFGELETPAHHAAVHMARALDTQLWWDIRR